MAKQQSIEPNIADLANGWLKKYQLDYKLEQETLNDEIDKALKDYFSKNGGVGANRPDAKLLLQAANTEYYPILIEYKGYGDKLVKLDAEGNVDNRTAKNEPNFKHINGYAVNGAVHYANALLHHTSYTDIIAIGMTGEKDEKGNIRHQIGVYYVSKSNLGVGQKVGEFSDFSFLAKENFDDFIAQIKHLTLSPEELEKLKEKREKEIDTSLTKLNNDIYQNEKGLGENDRVYLVAASIIATLGVAGKVKPLEKADLKSSEEEGNRDGEIIIRKINAFFNAILNKQKQNLLSVLVRNVDTVFKSTKISLPIKPNTNLDKLAQIDFDFMENFITQLEAYLLVTGLKDYTLTAAEQQALADFENGKVVWGEYKVVDLFDVKNTKNILSRDIIANSGSTPYLSASRENNAVSSYISYKEDLLDKGNCIFIGGKTFVVTYQGQDFYSNDSHNLTLYLKDEPSKTRLNQLFMVSCIYKSLGKRYSWGDSISNKKIQTDWVTVPIANQQPDYSFMEILISAVQKLVIKDVVRYADSKIAATKQVING